jgi:subtilase family serine protease
MRSNRIIFCSVFLLAAVALIFSTWTLAQTSGALSRITQAVDEAKTFTLRGNTHPMARPEFDQGAAPPDLPMERMMLVLRHSPEQEAALDRLMAEQLDKSSPNFHHWLTPEEFGQRFGPSDADIQTISSWLASDGFEINSVAKGRNVIEFSGNASQVREALHTEIHRYVVNGEEHWANASDPQIPAALTPVVAGVNTLHNFPRKPMSHRLGAFEKSKTTGEVTPLHPDFTFPTNNACGEVTVVLACFAVGPTDFATIYNVVPLWNAATPIIGTGVTIAVVGDSNINVQDARDFRALFGLPANDPKVILAGTDPGKNGDEGEADLDTQWSGAVAKGASIDLVIAQNTTTSFGVDLAAQFIVDHNLAPILSESFGACESSLGSAGNQFLNSLWQQAATQGITVLLSTGDVGSAGCEPNSTPTTKDKPATTGLAVSGLASTPFNTAVGGTDFDQFPDPRVFWNTTNASSTQASAKGYIPESTWNDSCTNQIWVLLGLDATPEASCNDTTNLPTTIVPIGAGGGVSSCAVFNGVNCSGYAKPVWQTALTPTDGKRDLPDVSLFAGAGLVNSFYIVCERDDPTQNAPCSTSAFLGFGGTSVSVQSFAGIVALIEQKTNSRQGLINPTLYTLAGTAGNTCASVANPAVNCIFYDVAKGTIAQPCAKNSPNCLTPVNPAHANSILSANGVTEAYDAASGYDLATGLGSVNALNLVNHWPTGGNNAPDFTLTTLNSTINVSSPGSSGMMTINLAAQNGFTGTFNISSAACSDLPSASSCTFDKTSITLNGMKTSDSTILTVHTKASGILTAADRRWHFNRPGATGIVAIAMVLCGGIILLKYRPNWRTWDAAVMLTLFALLITTAACGSGGSGPIVGGGGGGTPIGTTNAVVTFTDGATTHSLVFTVNVQ